MSGPLMVVFSGRLFADCGAREAAFDPVERTLSVHTIVTTKRELFYWAAILCTFALGTASGDLATEAIPLGFALGVVVFGTLIAAITAAYYFLGLNAVLAFWLAYIFTRPLGARSATCCRKPRRTAAWDSAPSSPACSSSPSSPPRSPT